MRRRNPTSMLWWTLGLAVGGAALVGGVAYAATRSSGPSSIPLSISGKTYDWTLPSGALTSVTTNASPTSTQFTGNMSSATGTAASNGATVSFSGVAVGTAQAVISWTDSSGKGQMTTLNFNVVA